MTFGEISEAQKRELEAKQAKRERERLKARLVWQGLGVALSWLGAGWMARGWLPAELPGWVGFIQAAVAVVSLILILRNWR